MLVALPVMLVVAGVVCLLIGRISLGIGMFAGAAVSPFAANMAVRRMAVRQLAYLCVPTTLTLNADGYEFRTEQSATSLKWPMFSEVVSTQEFWLFFIGRTCAGFLPRRAFNPAEQAELDSFFAAQASISRSSPRNS